jgi:uncharacterized protein YndB with AHSA1/START domain/uncharacterized protein YciI
MADVNHYFVQLLGTREGWPHDMTAEEERVMTEHYNYLKDLTHRKKVFMAGPVFDPVFGLIILATDSEQEAREIMEDEPSVKAGVHTYTMHPMRVSLLVEYSSPDRFVAEPSDRAIHKETTVPAARSEVWQAWTTADGARTFFAPDALIELRIGGPYEIYFVSDAPLGSRGSEDCRVLSWLPMEMLSFEWNAPPSFGELRNKRTRVIVQLTEAGLKQTKVMLTHVGWSAGNDWDRLFDYFDKAWGHVLNNLKTRFEKGPLEWSTDR